MTGNKKSDRTALDRLANAMVDDILNASDEELVAEVREDQGNPAAVAAITRAVFDKVGATVAKSRLAAAKEALAADRRRPGSLTRIDPAEARKRLEDILARDPETHTKLTLAARKGEGLSDEDVLGMLECLADLGVISNCGADDER